MHLGCSQLWIVQQWRGQPGLMRISHHLVIMQEGRSGFTPVSGEIEGHYYHVSEDEEANSTISVYLFLKQKLEICRHIICPRLAQNNCGDFCLVKWVLGLLGHGVEGLPESTIAVTKEVVSLWFHCGFLCFASWQGFWQIASCGEIRQPSFVIFPADFIKKRNWNQSNSKKTSGQTVPGQTLQTKNTRSYTSWGQRTQSLNSAVMDLQTTCASTFREEKRKCSFIQRSANRDRKGESSYVSSNVDIIHCKAAHLQRVIFPCDWHAITNPAWVMQWVETGSCE